jgi:hypothetical protein
MAVVSRTALKSSLATDIPDNSAGEVSPEDVRENLVDFADSAVFPGDALVGGFSSAAYDAGTKTTGTFTPDPVNGNIQKAVNNGAHTLAPPSTDCSMTIQYTNGASAGAITTSGFTIADVADYATSTSTPTPTRSRCRRRFPGRNSILSSSLKRSSTARRR